MGFIRGFAPYVGVRVYSLHYITLKLYTLTIAQLQPWCRAHRKKYKVLKHRWSRVGVMGVQSALYHTQTVHPNIAQLQPCSQRIENVDTQWSRRYVRYAVYKLRTGEYFVSRSAVPHGSARFAKKRRE